MDDSDHRIGPLAQQNRAAETEPSLGAKAPWRRTGTSSSWWWVGSRPCGSATVTRVAYSSGSQSGGSPLAEMGGIVIWRIIWCSAEGATEASVYRPHLRSASAPPPRRLPRQGGLCVLAPVHPRPRRARSAVDQAGVCKRRARRLAAHLRLDGHQAFPTSGPSTPPPTHLESIHTRPPPTPPKHCYDCRNPLRSPVLILFLVSMTTIGGREASPPVANPRPSPYTSPRPAPQPCP